jgi:multiple sugar transport system substrate-binding protein
MNILAETGGTIFSDDLTKLVIKDNEATYAVAKWFYDLSANRLTDSIINPSPAAWFGTDFNQAIVAMAQYGFWYGAMAETDVNRGGVIMLPGPTWTGTRRDPTVTATGMIMASATKVPEAAWKVFEFYNAGQPAVDRAGSGWGVPALMSMYELMPNKTEYEQQKLRVLQGELTLETPPLQFNPFLGETTVADSWNVQVNRALQGEITFDEVVANVESEINTAIQDGIQRIL